MTDTIGHVVPQPEAEGSADAPNHSEESDSALLGASGDTFAADQQDFDAKDAGALAQDRPHRAFAYAAGSNTLAASDPSLPSPAPESPFGAFADAAIATPEIVSGAALLDESPAIVPSSGSDLVVPSSGSELIAPDIVFQTDPVSNQADIVVQGVSATNAYGVTGAGIKIGIISDSFNTLGGAPGAEADGALPPAADVHILKDASSGTDEGQAMAEIVHSIAPNAQIYFYTAGSSDAGMAQAIEALQAAGCQIIVDDVAFLDEPYFEEGGTISQAVNQVVADGSTYFTAANNFAQSYYQGSFTPIVSSGTTFEDFNVAGAPQAYYEPITIPRGATVLIDLQWAQPFKTGDGAGSGNGSNYSLAYRLLSASGGTVSTGNALDKGGDPVQAGEFTNTGSSTTFYLEVYENQTGTVSPGEFKIVAEDDSFSPVVFNDPNAATGSGTVFGHEEDPSAITVGAVPESNPNTLEPFSGTGPGEFYYNSSGVALSAPVFAGKVNLLAPDGNSTTIFNPFYGTSAAAPAAAAVGALVLQANGALNPADIENVLDNSAQPTVPGTAAQTGAGLVDAYLAVGDAETLTFSETSSTGTLAGTHLNDTFLGGPGNHTINGEAGVNTLSYAAAPAAVTVNFATGSATNGFGGTDSFSNIQIVDGSAHNNSFVSGAAGATIYGGGGLDSLDFSLLAGGGLLALDGGMFAADQGSGSGSNAGTIDVTGGSSLEIFGTLANAGSLIANSADLNVSGTLTGVGAALVENGGIFELGGSDAAGVAFGGGDSTLKLDAPTSFTGDAISGLILGDVLDLVGASVASATVVGSTLSIVESGGTNFSYTVSGALAGDHFGMTGDGSTGTDLILESGSGTSFALAQATLNTSSTLNLGNARVGGTLSQTLSISNSATPPAESLDVSLGGTSGDATASGSISLLAAGATNTSGIAVGLGTASPGAQGGTVTLDNFSDGAGTDGSGTTSLGTGTISVSGNVYREATASASAPSTPLIFHVGGSGAVPITVTNTAANDGFSENLLASVGTASGVGASGTTPDIAAQGSNSAITATVSTASAGTVSGSVTLDFASDGTGIDGFGPTADGTQTVAINATVNNYAVAAFEEASGGGTWSQSGTSYTLSLGSIAEGAAPVSVGLGVLNNVTGPADLLSGSFGTSGPSAFTLAGFGAFSNLGAGQADTLPSVTLSTSTTGSFSETITLNSTGSNASGYSGALAAETLTITGTISAPSYSLASPTLNTFSPLNLGNARVGGTLGQALSITNSAAPPAESLDVALGGTTGGTTSSGSISLLAAGATDTSSIVVGLGTTAVGAQGGTVTLQYSSDGTGTDGSGTTSLGSATVSLTGTVYREATASAAAPSAPLIFHVGDSGAVPITVTNTAANDGFSENLIASVATASGVSASGTTGDVVAQGASSAITATVSTASAGTVSGSVTLNLQSDGTGIDGLGAIADGTATVAINATVDHYAAAAFEQTSGIGTLSQSGTSYTLSLGSIALGATPVTVGLGVLNNVTGPADLLSGNFGTSGPSAYTLAGFGAFSGLGAGQADISPSVTLATGTAGTFSETITLNSAGANASGYSAALAAETLTITGTIVTSMSWVGPSPSSRSGSFNTAADWSPAAVPASGTAVTIANAGAYTVTSSTSNTIASLALSDSAATLAVSGGTFSILGSSSNAGVIAVSGGATLQLAGTMTNSGGTLAAAGGAIDLSAATLSGGTLQSSAGGAFVTQAGAASALAGVILAGTVTVSDGTTLDLKGTDTNNGTIALASTGDQTRLIIGNITLAGSGAITLSNNEGNRILSNGTAVTFTNTATIAGAGTIGNSYMTLVNAAGATINANDPDALTLNTGTHGISNGGLIEATAAGGLTISSALTNTGTLAASGGNLTVSSAVSGTGAATISSGTLSFASNVAAGQAVTFAQNTTGTLALSLAQSFAGTVAGLTGSDAIDLKNFQFSGTPTIGSVSAISLNGSNGVAVTVKDGALSATINLLNQFGVTYSTNPASYTLTNDGSGAHAGTLLQLAAPAA